MHMYIIWVGNSRISALLVASTMLIALQNQSKGFRSASQHTPANCMFMKQVFTTLGTRANAVPKFNYSLQPLLNRMNRQHWNTIFPIFFHSKHFFCLRLFYLLSKNPIQFSVTCADQNSQKQPIKVAPSSWFYLLLTQSHAKASPIPSKKINILRKVLSLPFRGSILRKFYVCLDFISNQASTYI